jgi:hypothetical protein
VRVRRQRLILEREHFLARVVAVGIAQQGVIHRRAGLEVVVRDLNQRD